MLCPPHSPGLCLASEWVPSWGEPGFLNPMEIAMRPAAVVVLLCGVVLGASPVLAQDPLNLPEGTTDEEAAEALSGGTGLREIELAGPLITEASLVHIKRHWRLKRLVLKKIEVSEAWMADLRQLGLLEELHLINCGLTDRKLQPLRYVENLEFLNLSLNPGILTIGG